MLKKKILNLIKFTFSFCFISLYFSNYFIASILASNKNMPNKVKKELFIKYNKEKFLSEDSYILGPGDYLKIKYRLEQNISELNLSPEIINGSEVNVLNDGTIAIPYAGVLNISGMSLDQAKYYIEEVLKKDFLLPRVEISILRARPINISVIGEVERPGIYKFSNKSTSTSNEFQNPTVINAIQSAGGITGEANLKEVIIKRKLPNNLSSFKKSTLNFIDLIFKGDQSQNLYLFDGDIIILKKVEKTLDEYKNEILSANLAPNEISITVTGEVVNPGTILVKSGTPLVQGIFKAGGPTNWRASYGKANILRLNRNGSVTYKSYKINLKEKVSEDKNPRLKNGDIINVQRSNLAKTSDAIGAISKPVSGVLTIWSMFKLIED